MKTNWIALTLLGMLLYLKVHAAEPPVTFTVGPLENDSLIYAPMGAFTADDPATGRLWFDVRITNNGAAELTLTSIRVSLTGVDVSIPKSVKCKGSQTTRVALLASTDKTKDELVTVPHPAAGTVTIRLYFAGNLTPKQVQLPLVPYVPTVPGGQYFFPADEGDIGPNEYFSDGHAHLADRGQGWASDWQVYRIVKKGDATTVAENSDPTTNEGRLGWGVPIRAIADGVVLRTSTGWVNNPAPGVRAFQKMSEFDGEAIQDVKITTLSPTRSASLQRLPSGQIQLSVWDILNVGRQITRLGSSPLVPGELVSAMAIDSLSSTRVAGILRLNGTNNRRMIIWDILDNGATVQRQWSIDSSGVLEVSLTKLAKDRFATGVQTEAGNLQVSFWSVNNTGLDLLASNDAGVATSVCITSLSSERIATSLRSDTGPLKVIVWDLTGNGPYTIERRGEQTAENISRVAATRNAGGKWVTAMRTSPGGLLKLARWSVSDDGQVLTPELITTTTQKIENSALAIAPGTGSDGTDNAATASIVNGGTFKINAWGDPDKPGTYNYSAQNTAGVVTQVSLDELSDTEYVVGTRQADGNLQLMTWHWADGGGNQVILLHGDCRVAYYHLQDGSVDTQTLYPGATVAAGQMIGRMGNSGSSGAPHTHIQSDRISPLSSVPDMIAREALGTLPLIGPRPMPYSHARTMRLSLIELGGEGNGLNSFSTMNGQGMYDFSLGIRPRLNTRYLDLASTGQNPTGRKEVTPATPNKGGPFHSTVTQAVGATPPGSRLYIRGGSYNEPITITKPLLVRRYDYYEKAGSVLIGN